MVFQACSHIRRLTCLPGTWYVFFPSGLRWHIPGLSELLLRVKPSFYYMAAIVFSSSSSSVLSVLHVPRARQRGRARRHRGCRRALAGSGGLGRGAVAVFVATVGVPPLSRHEGHTNELDLPSCCCGDPTMANRIWVVFVCNIILKWCLYLRTTSSYESELDSLKIIMVDRAHGGHGEHRALREAGDGAHWSREGVKLHPDRIGDEVVARGAGSVRG